MPLNGGSGHAEPFAAARFHPARFLQLPRPEGSIRALLYTSTSRDEPGGTQTVFRRLAGHLRDNGHVVTEAWAGPPANVDDDEWICPLEVKTDAALRPAVGAALSGVRSLVRLSAGLAKRRPDVVNVHFLTGQTLYFLLFQRLFGYRTVLSAHGSDVVMPSEPCRRYLPYFFRWADAITVVSEDLGARVRAQPGVDPSKIAVIPNGIDYAFWSSAGAPVASPPRVVAIGRLEPVKGFDVLIRAFADVRRHTPDARLVVIGEGSRRDALAALADELGIGDAVELTGALHREAVRSRLNGAAAFALSSRSEGMPLVLLEAMAAGAPVVATRVGGVPEVLTDESGLVVPPDSPDALARALVEVLHDREAASRRAEAARRIAARHDSAVADRAYAALFERLSSGEAA